MPSFPHTKLVAYQSALQLAKAVHELTRAIPRGNRVICDQSRRASIRVVANIGEGASRFGKKEKAYRYNIARGECGEVAACIDLAIVLDLVRPEQAEDALELAAQTGRLVTGLIRSQQR